jgi:hypothetical protein
MPPRSSLQLIGRLESGNLTVEVIKESHQLLQQREMIPEGSK